MFIWVQFIICLAIIAVAGTRLAKYGDLIAEKTGLGRVWIGVVLLATVTSLPELATGASSIAFIGQPDLTLGNLFGANLLNLLIIVVVDLVQTSGPILHYLGTGVILSTILSLFMITAAATSLFLAQNLTTIILFGRIGIFSLALFLLYIIAQYMIFKFHPDDVDDSSGNGAAQELAARMSLLKIIGFFAAAALVTAAAGTWLAFIGDSISEVTGLGASFVGTLFLAMSTTAPEIAVSITAVRLGEPRMAVGNVVGSNLFNMGVIIFANDLFYSGGSVLHDVSPDHLITGLFAIMMSSIVIIGIIFRPRFWLKVWVGMDTVVLTFLYIGAIMTTFWLSNS